MNTSSNGSPRAVTDGHTVLATAEVPATAERAYRALNTNELEQWWGSPETYRMTGWSADLRVGGRWHVLVCGAERGTSPVGASAHPAGGEFLEVEPFRKVVFTRRYEWDFPVLGKRNTTVTYFFEPIDTGTRVTVRHDGFAGLREPADLHAVGWERVLGWLQAYLGGAPAALELNAGAGRHTAQSADPVAAMLEAFRNQLEECSQPFGLIVRFEVDQSAASKVAGAFNAAVAQTRAESGCLAFELNREARSPNRFVVHEQWRSFQDFEAHHRAAYTAALRDQINAVLVGIPEFRVLVPVRLS